MKRMYVDIGELGWSLYLAAHIRWLKEHTNDHIGVMTHADRHCLYNGVVDTIYDVPDDFYVRFGRGREVFSGLKGVAPTDLNNYFAGKIPPQYELKGFFSLIKINKDETIFKPYSYSKVLNGKKEILVFPRHRIIRSSCHRNLPKEFYSKMINALCDKFPDYIIRTIGILSGSYNITEIKRVNYINDIQQDVNLQKLIDRCQIAMVAIGSQSAPPKITLLQGVSTFMMGHQRERHVNEDNWMSTKVEFYDVPKKEYAMINSEDCINKIIIFAEGCQVNHD